MLCKLNKDHNDRKSRSHSRDLKALEANVSLEEVTGRDPKPHKALLVVSNHSPEINVGLVQELEGLHNILGKNAIGPRKLTSRDLARSHQCLRKGVAKVERGQASPLFHANRGAIIGGGAPR